MVQGHFQPDDGLYLVFGHNVGKFGASRHQIRIGQRARRHAGRQAQGGDIFDPQGAGPHRKPRMCTQMNKLTFHVRTIAKKSRRPQPDI